MALVPSPSRLARRVDRFGLALLLWGGCVGFYYAMFQKWVFAILAGSAMAVLCGLTIRMGQRRTLEKKEVSLRQRLGGEMAVDSLLMQSSVDATNNAGSWLAPALGVTAFQSCEGGLTAQGQDEKLFIACCQRHPSTSVTCDDVLIALRAGRCQQADKVYLCATAQFQSDAMLLSEDSVPRVVLIGREGLITLAGRIAPADDAQLSALGRRRRRKFAKALFSARILDASKAKRYAVYGAGMLAFYSIQGSVLYLTCGVCCLLLCVGARIQKKRAQPQPF